MNERSINNIYLKKFYPLTWEMITQLNRKLFIKLCRLIPGNLNDEIAMAHSYVKNTRNICNVKRIGSVTTDKQIKLLQIGNPSRPRQIRYLLISRKFRELRGGGIPTRAKSDPNPAATLPVLISTAEPMPDDVNNRG